MRISQHKSQRYVQAIFSVFTLGNKEIFVFLCNFSFHFKLMLNFLDIFIVDIQYHVSTKIFN